MSAAAEVYDATLTPDKVDLLRAWLAERDWFPDDTDDVEKRGSFRFVDPDGEVGIECFLLAHHGVTFHVPVTYRAEALPEAGQAFIGTTEHSVLGTRYVYDAPADPVYVAELERTIREGDSAAQWHLVDENRTVDSPVAARGSGIRAGAETGSPEVVRLVAIADADVTTGADAAFAGASGILTATWETDEGPMTGVVAVLP